MNIPIVKRFAQYAMRVTATKFKDLASGKAYISLKHNPLIK
ncbi:hypothetical protein [Roseivirga seohaensis]|nr:hypothetical protein [Roseivirga seohaensis]